MGRRWWHHRRVNQPAAQRRRRTHGVPMPPQAGRYGRRRTSPSRWLRAVWVGASVAGIPLLAIWVTHGDANRSYHQQVASLLGQQGATSAAGAPQLAVGPDGRSYLDYGGVLYPQDAVTVTASPTTVAPTHDRLHVASTPPPFPVGPAAAGDGQSSFPAQASTSGYGRIGNLPLPTELIVAVLVLGAAAFIVAWQPYGESSGQRRRPGISRTMSIATRSGGAAAGTRTRRQRGGIRGR